MDEKKRAPKLRFKGFTDDWEQRKLGNISTLLDKKRKPVKSSNRKKGLYPYYGATGIIDYIDNYIFDGIYLLVAEDGANIIDRNYPLTYITQGKFWLNNHAHILTTSIVNIYFLQNILERIDYSKFNTGTAQPKLNAQILKNINIKFPNSIEQQKIGKILNLINKIIALQQRKLDQLKLLKKAMLQNLFSDNNIPNLRFKHFHDMWKKSNLLDLMNKVLDYRGKTPKKLGLTWSQNGYLALSALNVKNGWIDKNSADAHYGDEQLYKKWMKNNHLYKGQVVFTTEAPMGNVAQIPDTNKYILSQRTIAFLPKKELDDTYLAFLLSTNKIQNKLRSLSTGGTAIGVSQKSLSFLTICYPNVSEQIQIGKSIKNISNAIHLQQKLISDLQKYKSFLLKNMFI